MLHDCYWSKSSKCIIDLYQNEKDVFIIGSNAEDRREYVEIIKNVIEDFKLNPIFAIDLKDNNNLQAFCNSICTHIRGSRLIIVDLSAPLKLKCDSCETHYLEPSVNVYWEYGYAAGLEKQTIILCEEDQLGEIPFDVIDKHLQPYTKENLHDAVKELINVKLSIPVPKIRHKSKTQEELIKIISTQKDSYFKNLETEINKLNSDLETADNRYVIMGASILPLSENGTILDFNDSNTDEEINMLYKKFLFSNPDSHIYSFENFIRDIKYKGDHYASVFERKTDLIYNEAKWQIFPNGIALGYLIFDCESGGSFTRNRHYFYDRQKQGDIFNASYIYYGLIPYLNMMYLKLARELYQNRFDGMFKISNKIVSPFNYFTVLDHSIAVSHTNNILIERDIKVNDLYDRGKIYEIIKSMITEYMRYFDFNLKNVERIFPEYQKILDDYLEPVFKFDS
ncbi:hypothetical protein LCGC14_1886160 [marine sediment metagenome]|uniref:CD-NTase-associated protein 12/Pycsar effector protein TIR domain-containing protein n=1 Tax=marine sediment metagenome TaxID=412755 RepID=A0A0F9IES8_9ZZZZ